MPFVTAHLEIFHCKHDPVIPKSDLYFTFCSTLNALSKRTSKSIHLALEKVKCSYGPRATLSRLT